MLVLVMILLLSLLLLYGNSGNNELVRDRKAKRKRNGWKSTNQSGFS